VLFIKDWIYVLKWNVCRAVATRVLPPTMEAMVALLGVWKKGKDLIVRKNKLQGLFIKDWIYMLKWNVCKGLQVRFTVPNRSIMDGSTTMAQEEWKNTTNSTELNS
jgi:hypothetical protein